MNIEAALLVLLLLAIAFRKPLARAAKRQIRKAGRKLGELILAGLKALGQAAWVLVCDFCRGLVSLA